MRGSSVGRGIPRPTLAAARTRLGYRALPDGEAAIDGVVVLQARYPFSVPDRAAHAVRLLAGRVQLVAADPLGRRGGAVRDGRPRRGRGDPVDGASTASAAGR